MIYRCREYYLCFSEHDPLVLCPSSEDNNSPDIAIAGLVRDAVHHLPELQQGGEAGGGGGQDDGGDGGHPGGGDQQEGLRHHVNTEHEDKTHQSAFCHKWSFCDFAVFKSLQ